MRTLARFAFALCTTALPISAACSLLVDTSGLEGGAADAAVNDPTKSDGATPDAASDATGGGGASWCAQQSNVAFCEDFDDPKANLAARWDEVLVPSGTLRVDDQNATSRPNALLAIIANPGNTSGNSVTKGFPPHASTRLALDLLLEASDSKGYGSVAEIHLDPSPTPYPDYRAALIYTAGQMTLNGYTGPGGEKSTNVPRTFAAWRRVQLEVALTPTPHAVVYDETGAVIATLPMPATTATATMRVVVGLPYLANATQPWHVRIDDVAVTFGD